MRFEDDIEEQFYNKFREMDVEKKECNRAEKVDGVEYKVYSFINDKPIDIDELVKCTNMDVQEINYEITMLTLEERVVELPGRKYILKGKRLKNNYNFGCVNFHLKHGYIHRVCALAF